MTSPIRAVPTTSPPSPAMSGGAVALGEDALDGALNGLGLRIQPERVTEHQGHAKDGADRIGGLPRPAMSGALPWIGS